MTLPDCPHPSLVKISGRYRYSCTVCGDPMFANRLNPPPGKPGAVSYRGVIRHPSIKGDRPYQARIGVSGQRVSLGFYATPEEAAQAYDQAVRDNGLDPGRLNFTDEPVTVTGVPDKSTMVSGRWPVRKLIRVCTGCSGELRDGEVHRHG
jgi:hypothetical protein